VWTSNRFLAYSLYWKAFASGWCFVAGAGSLVILVHFEHVRRMERIATASAGAWSLEPRYAPCITLGLTIAMAAEGKIISLQWLPLADRVNLNFLRGIEPLTSAVRSGYPITHDLETHDNPAATIS
jgi:hypothetical protein